MMAKKRNDTLVGSVHAEKAVVAQVAHVYASDKAPEAAPVLSLARILLDSSYWETHDSPRAGSKPVYPFDAPASHYYYLKELSRNNLDVHPTVVLLFLGEFEVSAFKIFLDTS
jgi:hypothetical protein